MTCISTQNEVQYTSLPPLCIQVVLRLFIARYGARGLIRGPTTALRRRKAYSSLSFAASSHSMSDGESFWRSMGAPSSELRLEFTLVTGQSFRWRKSGDREYTGVIQHRVVSTHDQTSVCNKDCSVQNAANTKTLIALQITGGRPACPPCSVFDGLTAIACASSFPTTA